MYNIKNRVTSFFNNGKERTVEAKKNVAYSLALKGVSILTNLIIIPLTIKYVNPTQYGIWLTLSSIIGWISLFDLGLGNGFRNKYAEAKAKGDLQLARYYLSTTYFSIGIIVMIVLLGAILINTQINWSNFLQLSQTYNKELSKCFNILVIFIGIQMVANVFSMLLTADQKPSWSALITCIGQILSLVSLYILTKLSDHGSLENLAIFYSGLPCFVLIIASILMFRFSRYKILTPKLKYVRKSLIKDILSLGFQFFIIYLCLIAVFQITNIVITREIGAYGVTQYNIANKYFNCLFMVISIIITPMWSAFTDAYTKGDMDWMKKALKKLEQIWLFSVGVGLIMLICAQTVYHFWLHDQVIIPMTVSVGMLIFVVMQSIGNIYMYLINGIGKIRLQTFVYIFFALISYPALTWSCKEFGLIGAVIIPTLTYTIQAVLGKIQITIIIKKKDNGLWSL